MDVEHLVKLVRSVHATGDDACPNAFRKGVADLAELLAWAEGRQIAFGRGLAKHSGFAEKELADAGHMTMRAAGKVLERGEVLEGTPALAAAIERGAVSAAHVDVVGAAMRQVAPAQRASFEKCVDRLVPVAVSNSPDELERRLKVEVRRAQIDGGLAKLQRQRRATGLRTWIDKIDGMLRFAGQADPVRGVAWVNQLDARVAELFAETTPEDCPEDPRMKNEHLRALAMMNPATGSRPGQPEFIVVADTRAIDEKGKPVIDWGLPVDIPDEVVREVAARAKVHVVAIHPPAPLDAGRTRRLATRHQRRVLRALYPTCAIPGCPARAAHFKAHHVKYWENGGCTDLDNLVSLCARHHTAVHDRGWRLRLDRDRTLTVTLPDGTVLTTGPPARAP